MGNPRIWNRQMVMDCKILDKSKMCVFVESLPNREQQGIEDAFTQKDHPNGGKPHFNDMRSVVRRRAHFRPIRHASLEHIFEVAAPLCLVVFVFAVKAKEMAITLPAIWLGCDLLLRSKPSARAASQCEMAHDG